MIEMKVAGRSQPAPMCRNGSASAGSLTPGLATLKLTGKTCVAHVIEPSAPSALIPRPGGQVPLAWRWYEDGGAPPRLSGVVALSPLLGGVGWAALGGVWADV